MWVRTYAEECLAIDTLSEGLLKNGQQHMQLCLAGIVRTGGYSRGCQRFEGRIEIGTSMRPNRGGYIGRNEFVGVGAPVYELAFEDARGGRWYKRTRAPNRAALRSALKRIFPRAQVSR